MPTKIGRKPGAVSIQPAKGQARLPQTLKKAQRDEMSTGKGKALRTAAEKSLGAGPFSAAIQQASASALRVTALGGLAAVALPERSLSELAVPPEEKIVNQALYDFLKANPQIKTVQDLVNACYREPGGGWDTFARKCEALGLPKDLINNRSANLIDRAATGVPTTVVTPPTTTPPADPANPTVKNPVLAAYLAAHPEIKTVQDLVNATYAEPGGGWDVFAKRCKELNLDPNEIDKYRSAGLNDWAISRPPPPGTLPQTLAEADQYHLTQYNTARYGTNYNTYFPEDMDYSDNCGPASLAMALLAQGKLPPGMNPEQEIDYCRWLIAGEPKLGTPNVKQINVNGKTYLVLDKDHNSGVGYGAIAGGAQAAGLGMVHEAGWKALDDALAAGHPVVAAGMISPAWKKQFPAGHYGAAGVVGHFIAILGRTADGMYIVSDPMFANGPVLMSRAQLEVFVGQNPDITAEPPPPAAG